jgi:uncharacterized protein YkwD
MFHALVVGFLMVSSMLAQGLANVPAPRPSTEEEKLVVEEMSKVRLHPKDYAKWLRTQLRYYDGTLWKLPGKVPVQTQEGSAAMTELISFLDRSPSVGPLRWREGLARAAQDFVREQGPTGQTGHVGPSGSNLQGRILRHGVHLSRMGEVINYGVESPLWTVMQLLIDDGVPSRGHRKVIFDADFHVAGAATGPHAEYGSMTVVDLADAFQDNP